MKKFLTTLVLLASLVSAHAQTAKTKAALTTEINTNFADNTAQAITAAIMRATTLDMVNSWQQYAVVNAQVGTTYTVVADDYGKLITFTNAAPVAVTLPQATGSFAIYNVSFKNLGAGTVTITPTTSTINGAATLVLVTGQSAQAVSDSVNYQTTAMSIGTPVPLANGGTNAALTAANGAIPYLTGSAFALLAPNATAGLPLLSGSNAAPTWAAVVYPSSGTSGAIPCFTSTNTMVTSAALGSGLVLSGGGAGACVGTIANGQLPATATNDNAASGKLGEFVTATVVSGSAVPLTNNTPADVTSVSLTAGDWQVSGIVNFIATGTTSTTQLIGWVSSTSATLPASNYSVMGYNTATAGANVPNIVVAPQRFSLSGTTNVFLSAQAAFTVSTMKAFGTINAWRMR